MNPWIKNIGSSYARFIVSIGAVGFMTPAIIEHVGLESYGIWALVLATVGLLGLMDFGLSTSAVKYVGERTGQGDDAGRNRVLSALLTVYTIISILILIVSATTAFAPSGAGNVEYGPDRRILMLAVGCTVAAGLYLSLFRAALAGTGRMYLANYGEMAMTMLYVGLTLLALERGYGLAGLAFALVASTTAGAAGLWLIARRRIPSLRLTITLGPWGELRRVLSFSVWAFVANAALLTILRMDPLIIGAWLPLTAVAVYSVAGRIAEYLLLLNKQFSNALMPLVSQAHGRGDAVVVRQVLTDGSRYVLAGALPLLALVALQADSLLVLWIGEEMRDAAGPLRILCAAVAVGVLQLNAANVLGMTGRHRFVGTSMAAAAGLNLALTVAALPRLGLAGAAWATLVAAVVVEAGVILPAACRHAKLRVTDFLRHALRPGLVGAASILVAASVLRHAAPPASLFGLIFQCAVAAAAVVPVVVCLGLSADERAHLAGLLARFRRQPTVTGETA